MRAAERDRRRSRSPRPSRDRADEMSRSQSPPTAQAYDRQRSKHGHTHHHHEGHRRHHHHGHHHSRSERAGPTAPVVLPYNAGSLRKRDFERYQGIFAYYLDIQKQLDVNQLPGDEVRGRWKSFVGKWNRGELAEGWYDPATLQKHQDTTIAGPADAPDTTSQPAPQLEDRDVQRDVGAVEQGDESSDDSMVGPALPGQSASQSEYRRKTGPAIMTREDVILQREHQEEQRQLEREDLRFDRKIDRKSQREHLDELVPRAEAGSKDRILEKKREKADSNRSFAAGKTDGGGMAEVGEAELYGGDDGAGGGGIEAFKKEKKDMERRKNERELRKEEILRARREEHEARAHDYRAREEKTMSGLVALARARFG